MVIQSQDSGSATGATNISELKGRQFSYPEVRTFYRWLLEHTESLVQVGSSWKLDLEDEVEGIDFNRTYTSLDELVDQTLPIMLRTGLNLSAQKAA